MGRNITDTTLYKNLSEMELADHGISPLSSSIAQHLQKVTEILLGEVGTYMPDYTLHNIDHVVNVLDSNHFTEFLKFSLHSLTLSGSSNQYSFSIGIRCFTAYSSGLRR